MARLRKWRSHGSNVVVPMELNDRFEGSRQEVRRMVVTLSVVRGGGCLTIGWLLIDIDERAVFSVL